MRVKHSLFALFGALFLLLAGTQTWLLRSLKDDINVEVASISHQMVEDALEGIEIPEPPTPDIEVPEELVRLAPDEAAELQRQAQEMRRQEIERSRQKVAAQIADARRAANETLRQVRLSHPSLLAPSVEVVHSANKKLWLGLALTSLLALLGIYLLAKAFSRPLETLAQGLSRVAKGEAGVQLKPQGMRELRTAMDGFNRMSLELARLKKEEAQMQDQAHLAELGDIARGLAHSLRNPIHTIGLALEGELDQARKAAIAQKLKQMDANIKALLTLSAQGVNRQQPLVLAELLADVRLSLGGQWRLTLPQHCTLKGDESELRAVFHALMSNALEAAPGKEASLDAQLVPGALVIHIRDQGPGLSDQVKAKLFTPHATQKADGAGMGLYIAERLVRLRYGGTLTLDNHPQGGAVATLTLPENSDAPAAG
ncbi:sensor histidine kinase [Gallaecimonas xiamenensis]|uniref:histidine kinase n=1 Tax=Gallaecimonas xiamenensis 3-C-1 TaxID=745411 RepID=K2J1H7_9GAMM|nr:HAMP domain-containing sensor histidine kinase [Gallaecimonas xiamenensis]EKE68642.1 integral membrane sensor signal transduction histidine kinase [Gallaecimonas xiamenensis 3-C-1]